MKSTKNSGLFLAVQGTNLIKATSIILLFMVLVFSISGLLTSLKPQFRPMSNSVNTAAQSNKWENALSTDGMGESSFSLY